MPLRLPLPDLLVDALDLEAAALGTSVEALAVRHLERSLHHPITDRLLTLAGADRRALEAVLGPIKDAAALVKAVANLNALTIQGVKITLEPWQLEEIHRKAVKNDTTVKQEIEVAVKAVRDLAFSGFHS